jgi:hypothetical protein
VTDDPAILTHIQAYKAWAGLTSLVKIVSERRLPDKITRDTRYFITRLPPDASLLLRVVRAHWHIENRLHWMLDIAFREDENRVRKDHAPHNLAVLRHLALNWLKQDTSLTSASRLNDCAQGGIRSIYSTFFALGEWAIALG